jgi:hypothetical protein
MAVEPTLTILFANDVVREVFKTIVEKRSLLFKEILASLDKKDGKRKELEDAVEALKGAELIKERSSPVQDFNSYYVTADGLTAARELRRANL